ncbi:unnamed protein product [Callosobruchus maculatus]|uniref:Endonuclease/exonuclease/phosphatase domain-containing protein n=1 Tax=Callosobruchus maculatus TaxID=64391 RepID=A0A653CUM8_CALMS|nr:unnamed protein product [Callosobruchus maculatus]
MNFVVYRCDRNSLTSQKGSGGGVIIFIRSNIQCHYISISEDRIEQLFILCQVNNVSFVIGGVYIPPNSPRESYTWHCHTVENIVQQYPSHKIFVFGDYNLPNAVWSNDEYGVSVQCPGGDPAVDVAQAFGYLKFYQHVMVPNNRNVFLDLVFSNERELNVVRASDPLLDPSLHHIGYECCLKVSKAPLSSNLAYDEFYYDFKNGNYIELNNYLASINWQACLAHSDINISTKIFYEIITFGIAYFIPLKRYKTSSFPKWFSQDLRTLTIAKRHAHYMYINNKSDENYNIFSQLRSECKQLSELCFNQYIRGIDLDLQNNPSLFWKYVNGKRSNHSLPGSLFYKDQSASNGRDIANLFKQYFQTVYSPGDVVPHTPDTTVNSNSSINLKISEITVSETFDAICALPNKITAGPDGIPNFLLKKCVCTIVSPLVMLFNSSLQSSTFPDLWKESFVVPVFKSGQVLLWT